MIKYYTIRVIHSWKLFKDNIWLLQDKMKHYNDFKFIQ